ncbi:MAG: hypothetical protein JO307_14115 [Bryobacterales bacterium]|nr:hypothetical protein [Bryobacterales bacterium]
MPGVMYRKYPDLVTKGEFPPEALKAAEDNSERAFLAACQSIYRNEVLGLGKLTTGLVKYFV